MAPVYFAKVEDAAVILYEKGVFRQADVYIRGEYYHARVGTGFVRMQKADNATSKPGLSWLDLYIPGGYGFDPIGRIIRKKVEA